MKNAQRLNLMSVFELGNKLRSNVIETEMGDNRFIDFIILPCVVFL